MSNVVFPHLLPGEMVSSSHHGPTAKVCYFMLQSGVPKVDNSLIETIELSRGGIKPQHKAAIFGNNMVGYTCVMDNDGRYNASLIGYENLFGRLVAIVYGSDTINLGLRISNRTTPENMRFLENAHTDVFVFGSNSAGRHGAGAALTARDCFGAVPGEGVGFFGNSYAIPTKGQQLQVLPLDVIKKHVDDFLKVARLMSHKRFFVTAIGCGLAGYTVEEIAPLFMEAVMITNILLPASFWLVISNIINDNHGIEP